MIESDPSRIGDARVLRANDVRVEGTFTGERDTSVGVDVHMVRY